MVHAGIVVILLCVVTVISAASGLHTNVTCVVVASDLPWTSCSISWAILIVLYSRVVGCLLSLIILPMN
jgi:hypothetical protein